MTARKYAVVANRTDAQNKFIAGLKGQAKVVMAELLANTEPRLGTEIESACGAKIVTKQDTLRIVLYYVVIFKGKGLVVASENVPQVESPAPVAGLMTLINAAYEASLA